MQQVRQNLATPSEAAEALSGMSDADVYRVNSSARLRAFGLPWLDPNDLLHEAIVRVLSGSRRWPKSIPFVAFMRQTIRSIANEHWRHRVEGPVVTEAEIGDDDRTGLIDDTSDPTTNPEREVLALEALSLLEKSFATDEQALAVIHHSQCGFSPKEIQGRMSINETQYASILRRIRRTLMRAIPPQETSE